jgi:hypothetical protein
MVMLSWSGSCIAIISAQAAYGWCCIFQKPCWIEKIGPGQDHRSHPANIPMSRMGTFMREDACEGVVKWVILIGWIRK